MAGQADNGHGTWLANLSANLTQEKADVFKQQLGSCLAAAVVSTVKYIYMAV